MGSDSADKPATLLSTFNFEVHLTPSGTGGDQQGVISASFSEITGLEIDLESITIREGGYNDGERRLVGKASNPLLILKRGVTKNTAFWKWMHDCTCGVYPLPYVDGEIEVFVPDESRPESGDTPSAKWKFRNGVVAKVRSADLNAVAGGAIPIEELHIAHEGLRRER